MASATFKGDFRLICADQLRSLKLALELTLEVNFPNMEDSHVEVATEDGSFMNTEESRTMRNERSRTAVLSQSGGNSFPKIPSSWFGNQDFKLLARRVISSLIYVANCLMLLRRRARENCCQINQTLHEIVDVVHRVRKCETAEKLLTYSSLLIK